MTEVEAEDWPERRAIFIAGDVFSRSIFGEMPPTNISSRLKFFGYRLFLLHANLSHTPIYRFREMLASLAANSSPTIFRKQQRDEDLREREADKQSASR